MSGMTVPVSKALAFHRDEYLSRMQRVEAAMNRAGLEALIAYSVGNQPGPVAYLGGYETSLGLHDVTFFVITPQGHPRYALLTNAYWDMPKEKTWTDDVFVTSDFGTKLAELLPSSTKRLGIAGYKFFPLQVYTALHTALPAACCEDATALLKEVAKVKSPQEIEIMRQVARISEAGGQAFLAGASEGANERMLVDDVRRAMLKAGADGLSFPTFLMIGPQVVTGIGFASNRTLIKGQQVNILCGARYQGYGDELGRVTTVGQPSGEVRAIMEITAEMHEAMQEKIRSGVAAADVAQASIAVARKHGMDSYLFKSINTAGTQGHGMGCWYEEPPSIYPESRDILETNMLIILEARLGKPGVGGAVITEPWVVTLKGGERLSKLALRTWPS
jgi:Xaa-Pro aminopeptidase